MPVAALRKSRMPWQQETPLQEVILKETPNGVGRGRSQDVLSLEKKNLRKTHTTDP